MENAGVFMETIRATVKSIDKLVFIEIEVEPESIKIPISEDKPNAVKSAFNKLISRLKDGEYRINLEDIEEDLYSQVAKEYIVQLNREILEVHGEMKEYGLIDV